MARVNLGLGTTFEDFVYLAASESHLLCIFWFLVAYDLAGPLIVQELAVLLGGCFHSKAR